MDNKDNRRLDLLNKAIRASANREAPGFVRPTEDAITAYLMGTASSAERETVQEAMETSAAFRREMIDLVRDLQALPHSSPVRQRIRNALWAKIVEFWSVPLSTPGYRIASAMAVVAAVAISLWKLTAPTANLLEMATIATNVPAANLVSMDTRSVGEGEVTGPFSVEDSAALSEIRRFFGLDSDFLLEVREAPSPGRDSGVSVDVGLVGIDGEVVARFSITTPSLDNHSSLWLAGMSKERQVNLYKVSQIQPEIRMRWLPDDGDSGVACVVNRTSAGFVAGRGQVFHFKAEAK